jgi:Kef-type K+ transport system membrane component KefB
MLLTFSLTLLFGFDFSELAYRLKLSRIVGMLLSGIVLGPLLLGLTLIESALIGSILAAVSPAIVVLAQAMPLSLRAMELSNCSEKLP